MSTSPTKKDEGKRSKMITSSTVGPSGRKCLVDILGLPAVFHDDLRQNKARKTGWLGTSAIGEKYVEYEIKVWSDLKLGRKFDLNPTQLVERIPMLKELDEPSLKDLWVQYKRHCNYEIASKQLVDEVVAHRDRVLQQVKETEAKIGDANQARATQKATYEQHHKKVQQEFQAHKNGLQKQCTALQGSLKERNAALQQQKDECTAKDKVIEQLHEELQQVKDEAAATQTQLTEARGLIETERKAAEKIQEKLNQENQELLEQMEGERKRRETETEELKDDNEDLKESLSVQRKNHEIKIETSNRIYEENTVLERQLQLKIQKIDELNKLNAALQEKLASEPRMGLQYERRAMSLGSEENTMLHERAMLQQLRSDSQDTTMMQERAMLQQLTNQRSDMMQARRPQQHADVMMANELPAGSTKKGEFGWRNILGFQA